MQVIYGVFNIYIYREYQLVFFSPEALFATLEWRRMLASDLYYPKLVAQTHRAHARRSMSPCAAEARDCRLSMNPAVPSSRPTLFHV